MLLMSFLTKTNIDYLTVETKLDSSKIYNV